MTGKGRGWDGERREERGERGVGFAKGIVLPRGKSAVLVCAICRGGYAEADLLKERGDRGEMAL